MQEGIWFPTESFRGPTEGRARWRKTFKSEFPEGEAPLRPLGRNMRFDQIRSDLALILVLYLERGDRTVAVLRFPRVYVQLRTQSARPG